MGFLQARLGPFAVWLWIVILVGAYLAYRWYSGRSTTVAATPSASPQFTQVPSDGTGTSTGQTTVGAGGQSGNTTDTQALQQQIDSLNQQVQTLQYQQPATFTGTIAAPPPSAPTVSYWQHAVQTMQHYVDVNKKAGKTAAYQKDLATLQHNQQMLQEAQNPPAQTITIQATPTS